MSGTCNAAAVARHRHTQGTGANEVRYGITASRELDVVIVVVLVVVVWMRETEM